MNLQLGCDDYPILDLVEDERCYRFNLAASFDDDVVGMGIVIQKGMKAGFDANMDLNQEHVYPGGAKFFRAGERSDRLVSAIRKLYGSDDRITRMVDEESFTLIARHQGEIDLASEPVKFKIFGRDREPFDENAYYESYFNIDLTRRVVFGNEKDPDYREPLLRGICASEMS